MFVTGAGVDAVAIVKPFQNEVDQTILAGHTPYAMAVSDSLNLLFVTNLESGDLTILDIETRALAASVHVGENPGDVLLTPDGEYALVIDRRTGNVSVVRIPSVLGHDPERWEKRGPSLCLPYSRRLPTHDRRLLCRSIPEQKTRSQNFEINIRPQFPLIISILPACPVYTHTQFAQPACYFAIVRVSRTYHVLTAKPFSARASERDNAKE